MTVFTPGGGAGGAGLQRRGVHSTWATCGSKGDAQAASGGVVLTLRRAPWTGDVSLRITSVHGVTEAGAE